MAACASPSSSHIPMDEDDSTLSTPHSHLHRRHGSNVSSESSSPMLLARHFHGKWMESPSSRTRNDKTVPSSPSPSLPASEHPDWLGSFQFGDIITTGTTGSIRTGTHSETHAITTIVMVDKKGQSKGGRYMKKELMEMKNDEHPHVLKLYDVLETWNRFYLILEHATGGSLVHHLLHHGALSRDESLRLTAQLIDATMYQHIHTTCMIDMDDVMLDHEMDIKLMDTRIRYMIWADQEGGPKPSHPHCSPPELLDTNISNIDTSKCDVWTIGCLFYLMLTGEMPFGNDADTNTRIMSGEWIQHTSIDTECNLLLQLMLASTPTSRSTLLSLSTNSAFRDHTFLSSSIPSSVTTSTRSLTSTPLTDVMMTDVEEEDRVQPLHEKKELRTSLTPHNNGISTLQSRLEHLHELALMSPATHKRRISGQSVLPSSIYVPQSDPPTPSRSKSTSQVPSQSPSVAASPLTPFRSLSATASPSNFRRSLPHLTIGSTTGSPREANRRLSSNSSSSRARVVLVNENINGDEAIWRPTVVPSPARPSTTTVPRIPSPQPTLPLIPPLNLNTSKSNGATSISPSIPTSPDLPARAITVDPSPRKLPIDPMYASPRISTRPLKGFMPSFHLDTTSQPESPVNSRPRTPHPAIAVDDMNATTIEAPIPIAATQPVDLMRPSPHRDITHELAHLSIDAQTTPHSTSRHIIPERSHTGSITLAVNTPITLAVSTPITTVTTPRVQPPPAKSSFPSSPPIAATCPMPTRRLSLPSPSSHDDHHTLIKNPIKAHHQHGYLTTSIYQMEIDGDIMDVTKKLIHVMKDMNITYKQQHHEFECEYTPSSTNDTIKSPINLQSEKDDTSTHDHVKFHIELKSEINHTCIRLDHVFGSFDIYRTAFMKIRQALHELQ